MSDSGSRKFSRKFPPGPPPNLIRSLFGAMQQNPLDYFTEMAQLALRIVGKTLFDADVTRDAKEVGETLDVLLQIAANFGRTVLIPLWVPTPRNLRAKLGIKRLEKVIYRIIENRRSSGRDS